MVCARPRPAVNRADPDARALCCGLCQRPIIAGLDGRRVVAACTSEHVDALQAAAPRWCDEQLWFGQLTRAQQRAHSGSPLPLPTVARRAGMSIDQAQRALAWRRGEHRTERYRV